MIAPRDAFLPDERCCLCGAEGDVVVKSRRFTYTPSWVYLGLIGGIVPLFILALIGQKRGKLDIPSCAPCKLQWTLSEVLTNVFAILGLFACPALGAGIGHALDAPGQEDGLFIGMLVGLVGWIVGIVLLKLLWCRKSQARCVRIEGEEISLAFPRPEVTRRALEPPAA